MKHLKSSALALALIGVASTSVMAQSSKTNAWEGAYSQWTPGFATFVPKVAQLSLTPVSPLSIYPAINSPITTTGSANNLNTATDALNVGYNFSINERFVLGVGASYYIGASKSGSGTFSLTSPGGVVPNTPLVFGAAAGTTLSPINTNIPMSFQLTNLWSVTLAPGYAIDKDKLIYAKVGYTGVTIALSSPISSYQTTHLSGYTVGAGYKQMLTKSLYIIGEANYGGFSNKSTNIATADGSLAAQVGGYGYEALIGLGYRF